MPRWKTPNWNQRLIADAIGLKGKTVAIGVDDDVRIVILAHKLNLECTVNKGTGEVAVVNRSTQAKAHFDCAQAVNQYISANEGQLCVRNRACE